MYVIQLTITAVIALLNILLGAAVFIKNPKSATHRLFAAISLITASWAISNFFSLNLPGDPDGTLFWIRTVMVITAWLGPVLMLFVRTYPRPEIGVPRWGFWLLVGYAALTSVLATTPYMFSSVTLDASTGNITPTPGPAIALFALGFMGLIGLALVVLIVQYLRTRRGREKTQLGFLIVGMVLTFSFQIFATFIVVLLFKSSALVFLGPSSSIILVGCVSYAIIRHRFLDLKIVIFRALSFFLMLTVAAVAYIVFMLTIGSYLFDVRLTSAETLFFTTITFLVSLSLPLVRRAFEGVTAPVFFHNYYDDRTLLKNITDVITSTIVLDKLATGVFKQLFLHMHVSSAHIIIYGEEDRIWTRSFRYDPGKADPTFALTTARTLMREDGDDVVFVFDELENEKMKERFRKMECAVVLPLVIKREMVGVMLLGEKASGEPYASRDVELLTIVAPELAVGIKNALAYQEIQDFNERLKEEVREATTDLRGANRRLKELDARKDEFISIASHELRTPMTAIRSYLWLSLYKPTQKLDDTMRHNLEVCYGSTERLLHMVNELLTISRIEQNRFVLTASSFDLAELLTSISDELVFQAKEKNVTLDLKLKRETIMIEGDKEKIREVVHNLVGNALKFTPGGGTVTLAADANKERAKIAVSDTGPGIRRQDRDKLFTKFGKFEYAYRKAQSNSGTGLGLYISKKIVDLHHGEITLESVEGKGTTFTVELPLSIHTP
jgi:signal transduction histidine kinase